MIIAIIKRLREESEINFKTDLLNIRYLSTLPNNGSVCKLAINLHFKLKIRVKRPDFSLFYNISLIPLNNDLFSSPQL